MESVVLHVPYEPGVTLTATISDAGGQVFDLAAGEFRRLVEKERPPAMLLTEDTPGCHELALPVEKFPGGRRYTVHVSRDDIVVRVIANSGGNVSSRDDWYVMG